MRHLILITTIFIVTASVASAENLTEVNAEKAAAVIAKAVDAYGGAEHLAKLKTVVIEHETEGFAVGQSRKPEPPWDRNHNAGVSSIDLDKQMFATTSWGDGGGFEFNNGTIINGEASYQLDYRAGLARPVAEPDYANASGPFFRVTPALLVLQLQQHARTAHYLGEVNRNGAMHSVVGFSMEVGPAISLYFDNKTHLLTHSERVFPGFGLVEYDFTDYKKVDGIPFNGKFTLHLNGDLNMQRRNLSTAVNVPVDQYFIVSPDLEKTAALEPDELSRQQLGDGVFLIGGTGTYAMFIEMADHVIAVGGTAGMPERIAQLREVVPEKPIRYGVLTHHHTDHVVAVPTYAEEGAIAITAAAHKKVVKEAAGDMQLKVKTVDDRIVLRDQRRRVEIIDIGPTAHTEHLLVVWLPEEKILFEADHFSMPRSGPVPPAVESTRTFAMALQKLNIEPAMFVSAHSPRTGTMADLRTALNKNASPLKRVSASGDSSRVNTRKLTHWF